MIGGMQVANKIAKLKQDIVEVKGKLDDLEQNTNLDFKTISILLHVLHDVVDILDKDLKDHLETVENFICDVK